MQTPDGPENVFRVRGSRVLGVMFGAALSMPVVGFATAAGIGPEAV